MFKVSTNIEDVLERWNLANNYFLNIIFLKVIYNYHPNIKHLFIINNDTRFYAQIFNLQFQTAVNYLNGNSFYSFLMKYIRFNVLYLNNTFATNIPAYQSNIIIDFEKMLSAIKQKYELIVIPDFLYHKLNIEESNYSRIEVEEEMILGIRNNWKNWNDYYMDLRKKYRANIRLIIAKSKDIEIKMLSRSDLEEYKNEIQILFNQVVKQSKFSGPLFNTDAFIDFIEHEGFVIYGYFIENELVGFASEIDQKDVLYSYYVGFDKKLNLSYSIYGRMLIETIRNAISLKKKKVILGRTANEFKSNFGAEPKKSYVYIKINNRILNYIFQPIFTSFKNPFWIQRRPFRNR